jgi:hypothetical protein
MHESAFHVLCLTRQPHQLWHPQTIAPVRHVFKAAMNESPRCSAIEIDDSVPKGAVTSTVDATSQVKSQRPVPMKVAHLQHLLK